MGPDRGITLSKISFIKIFLIFLLNNLVNAELRAKGSPHAIMQVKKFRKFIYKFENKKNSPHSKASTSFVSFIIFGKPTPKVCFSVQTSSFQKKKM